MWEFEDVRSNLINSLHAQPLSAVERISIGRLVHLAPWMIEGYQMLCCQSDPLSKEVGERLGWKSYREVAKLREGAYGEVELNNRIEEVFEDELRLDPTYKPTKS